MKRKLTPYYAFRIFISVKAHFHGRYNLPDKKWKFMNPARYTFDNWNGKQLFNALVEYKIENMQRWTKQCIVMFKDNPSITYDEVLDEFDRWRDEMIIWEGHIANMPYVFENEMNSLMRMLFEENMTFDARFPLWTLNKFLQHAICVESFIILKKMLKFGLDGNPNYEYLYKEKYQRYELILNISPERYRKILEQAIISEKRRYIM